MTTTIAGPATSARPQAHNTARTTRWQQWRATRAARSYEVAIRRHEREDRTDRYVDRFGAPPPADMLAVMWQR